MYTRRKFIEQSAKVTAGVCLVSIPDLLYCSVSDEYQSARHYRTIDKKNIKCGLCFRGCVISDGNRGFCRVRENRKGKLFSVVYGKPAALQLDPIEKEPMYHIHPGSDILCTGTASCNFRCQFCHNWHLSQSTPEELNHRTKNLSPKDVVNQAKKLNAGLSFTYNEPTIFYEYMYDISELGKKAGLITIFHTNGGMQPEPMRQLLKNMAGVTVDLKGFTADFYKDVSFANMKPVLETLKLIKKENVWLEIVNLIIPTLNDNFDNIKQMCTWIVENLGKDVPVHFNRFSPAYKMKHLNPTPISSLERARKMAIEAGIKFVYIGNAPGHKHNSTYCPNCDERLIHRTHFSVHDVRIKKGKCEFCGYSIPGIWKS
ncbi:MAG: AmmeMemoRadiSam system radical SAM enzyme [Bacteroidetes bacterium]|nr:AmmeMemoRadiSam system radical SAM enzyme [Bacteroidota bacterium]MBU2584602.1 AmmeMemoRadiSam system radical SAM enzyme [Bacteroidota bacterium]